MAEGTSTVLKDILQLSISHEHTMQGLKLTRITSQPKPAHAQYRDIVTHHHQMLTNALDLCGEIRGCLEVLTKNYEDVNHKTSKVDTHCQALLKEQEELTQTANDLRKKLSYFNQAHHITMKIKTNELAMKIVNSPELHDILQKLDSSLQFMRANSKWKEAQRYLGVFTRLQDKVLTTVKLYFTTQLRSAAASLRQESTSIDKSDVKMASAKAFVEFQSVASKMKPLIQSIQDKAGKSEQYQLLLTNLYQTFAQYRLKLLRGEVQAGWKRETEHHGLPDAVRSGCSYIINTLTFEYQLFEHFFEMTPQAKPILQGLLSGLSAGLYAGLRPVLIQEVELEPIASAILVLRRDVLELQVLPRGEALGQFVPVINRLLSDMQLRLAYRAQTFINEQIASFEPSSRDVNYPQCLVIETQATPPVEKKADKADQNGNGNENEDRKDQRVEGGAGRATPAERDVNSPQLPSNSSGEEPGTPTRPSKLWYPTLGKTVMCLFKLHQCVEPGAFSHLAQEAILHCTNSLRSASKLIEKRSGRMHAQLFLIKYLLILRSQISVLNINRHHQNQLDFSHMADVVSSLVAGKASFESLLRDGTPNIIKREVNAKKMLEAQLKVTCEQLITQQSDQLVGDLAYLLQDLNTKGRSESEGKLGTEKATKEEVGKLLAILKRMASQEPERKDQKKDESSDEEN